MARRTRANRQDENGNHGLGARLRHARIGAGLYLKDLAEKVGCSESLISKIENEKILPSLSMLHRIAHGLGISIARLVEDTGNASLVHIYRPQDAVFVEKNIRTGKGIRLESIVASSLSDLLQINIHHIQPGGSSDGTIEHQGHEFGYILEGEVSLHVAGEQYSLKRGEGFFFRSNLPHGYNNPGKTVAKVLWINTPPTF
ncbi:cupin domain-containing protein [Mesorhizobium sp. KR9-304]|uniref:cupin domain-containing protein n=1 Tax=Mesorhizobium sp. KR9-304 TaxID=3156614 RepID=UPI0032B4C6CE